MVKPVALDAIPVPGLDFVVQGWAMGACAEGLGGAAASVSGNLHVSREGGDIGVRGPLSASADVTCDRCGQPARLQVETDVDCLYLAPRAEGTESPESDFAELGEYDGVTLDLAHVVRESLALERPMRVLCGDLDPAAEESCLARWRESAGAPERAADPRLAVLQHFKPVH